jgi:hypothetical protein
MIDMDDQAQQYLKLRQKREILKERFTAEDSELEKAMAEIEAQLLDSLNETNSTSMSTNSAVIMRSVRRRYMPTNWDAVYKLIDKHKAFSLLEKRVHNGNMKDFLDDHPSSNF